MVVIAYVGVASALIGAVVGWQFLGELSDANRQGLVLAEESLTAAEASLVVADDIIEAVDGVAQRGQPGRSRRSATGSTRRRRSPLRPPNWRRRCRPRSSGSTAASSRSKAIANTIDSTLSQLSRIPLAPDYDPAVTLSDAIGDLRADLAPLADDVNAVSDDLSTFSASGDDLAVQLEDLASSVTDVQVAVGGTTDVIDRRAHVDERCARTGADDLERDRLTVGAHPSAPRDRRDRHRHRSDRALLGRT